MTLKSIFSKGLLMSLIALLVAIYFTPVLAQDYDDLDDDLVYSIAACGKVSIHQSPSADSPVVGELLTGGAGATLDDFDSNGIWYEVTYGDITGYVNALCVSGDRNDERVPNNNANRTTYYVVVNSYDSLEALKADRGNKPDGIDCSPAFKGEKDGKTVYNLCVGIYYNRKEAVKGAKELKEFFDFDTWVWESKGQAECVERPIGYNGKPVRITPAK